MMKIFRSPGDLNRFIIFLCLMLTLSACTDMEPRQEFKPQMREQGELLFYLQPLPQEMERLGFRVSQLSVIPEQGQPIPLLDEPLDIAGSEGWGQKQLLSTALPPGQYAGIALEIEAAAITTDRGVVDLLPPSGAQRVSRAFLIKRGGILPLFLTISPEFLVSDGYRFSPRFVLQGPQLPTRNFLGFVSNKMGNSVSVFNKRSMEVVQAIRTGTGPTGMALDQKNGILYVAAAGSDIIDVISSDVLQPIGRMRLQFGDEPFELALNAGGDTLISVNRGSSTVSILNTRSLSERERLVIDPDPVWVSAARTSQRFFVLHALTNSVSVIDLGRRAEVESVTLDETPWRSSISRDGNSLYIITQRTPNLLVFDVQSLTVTDRIFVGNGSSALTVDPKTDLIYVGKSSGEIVIVDPAFRAIIDGIPTGGRISHMAIGGEENVLHVLSAESGTLRKFTLIGKKQQGVLKTDMSGHAVTVMGEL